MTAWWGRLFAAACVALALPAAAQGEFRAGTHFVELQPAVRTADPSKIEVVELFAYSCPACFRFEPVLRAWAQRQGSDVKLVQTHVAWNPAMEPLMRGYYTLQTLQLKDRAHLAAFEAIHVQRRPLAKPEDWAGLLSGFGVPKEKVLATYQSFGVLSQVKQAEAQARAYGVASTPEIVVNGRYRVSVRAAGGYDEMLRVVDFLVARERAARGAQR